jgi:hypothetical protein
MAPFRVLRREATRCNGIQSVPRLHGADRKRGLSSRRLIVLVTIGRASRRARLEPRARRAVPTEAVLRLTLKLFIVGLELRPNSHLSAAQ